MAWSRVQGGHNVNSGATSTTLAITLGANFTAGNLVCGMIQWSDTVSTSLSSVKIGTTSATLKNGTVDSGNGQAFSLFYFINNPGGANSITATFSAGKTDVMFFVDEFTTTNVSTSTFDGSGTQVQNAPGAGGTANLTGTIGASGDLIYFCSMNDGAAAAEYTTNAAFTLATDDKDDASFFGLSARSEFQTATGAINPSMTVSTNNSVINGGLAFTPGGGGGGTTLTRRTLHQLGTRSGSRQQAA